MAKRSILAVLLATLAIGVAGAFGTRPHHFTIVPNTGALIFANAADNAATGTVAWTNTAQATSNDGLFATSALSGDGVVSHYLVLTNPSGISIPAGATINGIQIDLARKAAFLNSNNTTGTWVIDLHVYAVKGGTIQTTGTDQKNLTKWATTSTLITYGSSSDLWGGAWASTDFGSNFGVAILVEEFDPGGHGGDTASIDYAQVTVTYTGGGSTKRRCTRGIFIMP